MSVSDLVDSFKAASDAAGATASGAAGATAGASAAAAAPRRKLCARNLTGECKYGPKCNDVHDNSAAAKSERDKKKTCNICGFYPNCSNPDCTFLHLEPAPRADPPPRAELRHADPRRQEPHRRQNSQRRQEPPQQSRGAACARRIAGKVRSLVKAEEAFRSLHKEMPGGGFGAQAEQCRAMVDALTKALEDVLATANEYLATLKVTEDETDDE